MHIYDYLFLMCFRTYVYDYTLRALVALAQAGASSWATTGCKTQCEPQDRPPWKTRPKVRSTQNKPRAQTPQRDDPQEHRRRTPILATSPKSRRRGETTPNTKHGTCEHRKTIPVIKDKLTLLQELHKQNHPDPSKTKPKTPQKIKLWINPKTPLRTSPDIGSAQ